MQSVAACGAMCQPLREKSDTDDSQNVTQAAIISTGANGCSGFSLGCQGIANDAAVIMTVRHSRHLRAADYYTALAVLRRNGRRRRQRFWHRHRDDNGRVHYEQ